MLNNFKRRASIPFQKSKKLIRNKPLTSFFIVLGTIAILLVISRFLREPVVEEVDNPTQPILVQIFQTQTSPTVQLPATVTDSSIVTITAQTAGIVNQINYQPGETVSSGQILVNIGQTYTGGNAAETQLQIQRLQNKNFEETFDTQLDIINRQREITNLQAENTEELAKISQQSATDTELILGTNRGILNEVQQNLVDLKDLQEASPSADTEQAILSTQAMLAQYQSTIANLQTGLEQTRLQFQSESPTVQLAEEQRTLALKQLDIQEQTLRLNRQLNNVQLRLAQIQTAIFNPQSPFKGIIEQIHVRQNQTISPGMPLITISSSDPSQIKVTALATASIAAIAQSDQPSTILINQQEYSVFPTHIATSATDGQLYAITYYLEDPYFSELNNVLETTQKGSEFQLDTKQKLITNPITHNQSATVLVPIALTNTTSPLLIPVDAIHQSTDQSYVFIAQDNQAQVKQVELGKIYGGYIEIESGLEPMDSVILNRNILAGDPIEISN